MKIQKVTPLILFLRWSYFFAVSERANSDIFTSVYCCLNHAVMPSALRVFSQLFVFFSFHVFHAMFISDYILYSNNNSPSGK